MVEPVYNPTNGEGGFPSLHALSGITVLCGIVGDSHADWSELIFHGGLDLHFSKN